MPHPKFTPPPAGDVIVGADSIGMACGGYSGRAVRRWVTVASFPARTLPDGRLITTLSAIREWVMDSADAME